MNTESTPESLSADAPRNVSTAKATVNGTNEVGLVTKKGHPTAIELSTALEKLNRDELTDEEWTALNIDDDNPSERQWTWINPYLVGAVAIALIFATGAVVSATKGHNNSGLAKTSTTPATSLSSNLISASLPLYVCNTTYGINTKAANLPASLNEMVPPGAVGKLVVYTDAQGIMKLLGPPNWGCTASIGADGSSGVTIAPMNSTVWNTTNYSGILGSSSIVQEINGLQNGACQTCALTQACPLFSAAARQYSPTPCPTTAPTSEVVDRLTKNVVEFTDPPGVHGDANPSGGLYAARGVMAYFFRNGYDGISSWMNPCVLPPSEQSLCSAVLSNFTSSYGGK